MELTLVINNPEAVEIEQRLQKIISLRSTIESTLNYKFINVEYLLLCFLTESALEKYCAYIGRTYFTVGFLNNLRAKENAFATIGDTLASSVVMTKDFIIAAKCTANTLSYVHLYTSTSFNYIY